MIDKTAARLVIRDTLLELQQRNRDFSEQLLGDNQLPAWVMNEDPEDSRPAREKAADAAARLTYRPDQQKQKTSKCYGLVGISENTLTTGKQLNEAKLAFKQAIGNYRKLFGAASIETIEFSSRELRDSLLGNLKLHHLHFVQCYRQLKLFPVPPKRAGFSWAKGTCGSVRLTAKTAIRHLQQQYTQSQSIIDDIISLQQLPPDQSVVIKRPLAPHLRANLTWDDKVKQLRLDPEEKARYPLQVNTPLPLFILLQEGQQLPEFNQIKPLALEAVQDRLKRSDRKLKPLSDKEDTYVFIDIT